MKHKRLVVGAVVSSVLVGASWGSVASAQPKAAAPAPGVAVAAHRPNPVAVASARANETAAQPTVQHLDPALAAVAGVPGASRVGVSRVPVTGGTVDVSVTGPQALAAARSVGAEVLGQFGDKATVSVATGHLQALAAAPGVEEVTTPTRPTALAGGVTNEGVTASGANAWAADGTGKGGAGVKIGIVDVGFGGLGTEEANGNIAGVVYPAGQNHCGKGGDTSTSHGTAVAEIAHQMAPQAQIYLYCIVDSVSFSQAAAQLTASGVKIVNSSLGFVGESRGDGNGPAGTTEAAVKKARQAGVLWIQSSGNSAQDHWSGSLADADGDTVVDMNGPGSANEADEVGLAPGGSGASVLTWNQWPVSSLDIRLEVYEFDSAGNQVGTVRTAVQKARTAPSLEVDYSNSSTTDVHYFDTVIVMQNKAAPGVRFDLFELGEVGPSYLSSVSPAHAAGGSVEQPATSPYAVAVGAAYWHTGKLEPFSSRGATIDGRVKPDLLGFDGVSSNIDEVVSNPTTDDPTQNGFYGTSAASPHVAGAAALMLAAHPSLSAADLTAYLELKTTPLTSPATNTTGNGLLHLPAPTTATCAVAPVLPAKVSINSAHVTFGSTMTTTCAHFYERGLLTNTHGAVDSLTWLDKVRAIGHLEAATDLPGWYSAAHQVGFSAAGATTFKAPAKMLVKYATTTRLTATRSGRTVSFTAHATNYSKAKGRMVPAGRRTVLLQRLVHGKWVNVLSRPTSTTGVVTVKFVQPTSYRYRLTTTETGSFFGATSAEAVR